MFELKEIRNNLNNISIIKNLNIKNYHIKILNMIFIIMEI